MKTVLLIIAISAFNVAGTYAQNKNCACAKTAARHKTIHHKLAAKTTTNKPLNDAYYVPVDEGCYTYTKHNIVVTECPTPSYDNSYPDVGFIRENNYLGYYPTVVNNNITESVAPLSNHLVVSSSAFEDYGVIPSKYTCEGEHASPPLSVSNMPIGAKSLAVVMYDPNASGKGSMTYWLVWNIDTTGDIPENFISDNQSVNAANEWGYQAVCPVSGTHYYHFMVYALDTKLREGRHSTKASLEKAMRGHVLSTGELVGVYNKNEE